MAGVTWGSNTVHNIGANPAPASNFGFGSTTASPSPAPGGSLFGTPAQSYSTGAFGAAAQSPQQSQQQYVPQQQIPAQAAMQAKMTAERVVETERIRNKLEKLYRVYTGTHVVPEDGEASARFCAIVYNDLTPEELQVRMIHGMTTGYAQHQGSSYSQSYNNIFRPPRPNQITGRDWEKALVENPDPNKYVPTPIVGAVALQARVTNQQNRSKEYAKNAADLQKHLEFIREREAKARQDLIEKDRQYAHLKGRLLEVMKKVEVARCLNQPLQLDEHRALQRLTKLLNHVEQLRGAFLKLQNQAKTQIVSGKSGGGGSGGTSTNANNSSDLLGVNKNELLSVLTEQRRKLEIMTDTAKKDLRDVDLIGRRVVASFPH